MLEKFKSKHDRRESGDFVDILGLILQIVITTIIVAPILWLAGRALVGKEKAKFTDALWIVLLGTIIGAIVGEFVGGIVASIIMFIVWLGLIKHFFDTGWIMALAIAIIAVIIFLVIAFILALVGLGIGILTTWAF